ncbi:unnamed protein product [Amoebophrya sp. A120]|nr:unnamed protein product [Amoebophrya sp. A120]|eukprot:GSA120T00005005001.1
MSDNLVDRRFTDGDGDDAAAVADSLIIDEDVPNEPSSNKTGSSSAKTVSFGQTTAASSTSLGGPAGGAFAQLRSEGSAVAGIGEERDRATLQEENLNKIDSYNSEKVSYGSGSSGYGGENIRSRRRQASSFNASAQRTNKLSYTPWDAFSTVSFRRELTKDVMRQTEFESGEHGRIERVWFEASSWVIPGIGGFMGAASASFIEIMVEKIFTWRNGYCVDNVFATAKDCCGHDVVANFACQPLVTTAPDGTTTAAPQGQLKTWGEVLGQSQGGFEVATWRSLVLAVSGVLLTVIAAILVKNVAPAARGSGIPEIKTILGGFHMPAVLSAPTLFIKCIGLCLVVSAGMCLGKEGPLVHVSCCWAMLCSTLLPGNFAESHAKVRELLSAGAAAGVSVAFGAPLGGVLFSFEEVSTFFPSRTCSRAFFAAVCAALSLQYFDPTGTGKLTMFQVTDTGMIHFMEYIPFAFLGVIGGVLGAIFVRLNGDLCATRASVWWRCNVPVVAEVACIAAFTVVVNSLNVLLVPLGTSVIHRLFAPCSDFFAQGSRIQNLKDELELCSVEDGTPNFSLVSLGTLALACFYRFLQMTITFGTGIPAGLFVPSLFCGACIGRMLGNALWYVNLQLDPENVFIDPGVYAMIGAAAMLGGVCRVTISLVVIMFELTGALEHIVPFMLAVQVARWVGDVFGEGIYDCHIRLRKYPYLHEPEDHIVKGTAADIMDDDIDCICVEDPNTVGTMTEMLEVFPNYNGFPLVRSEFGDAGGDEWVLLGYIHANELRAMVDKSPSYLHRGNRIDDETPVFFDRQKKHEENPGLDYSALLDDTIIRIVPETPLFLVHQIFHKLGLRFVAVVSAGKFRGLITKKAFVRHLQEVEHTEHLAPAAKLPQESISPLSGSSSALAGDKSPDAVSENGDVDYVPKHKTFMDDPTEWATRTQPVASVESIHKADQHHLVLHPEKRGEMDHAHVHHVIHPKQSPILSPASSTNAADEHASSAGGKKDASSTSPEEGSTPKRMSLLSSAKGRFRAAGRVVQAGIRLANQGTRGWTPDETRTTSVSLSARKEDSPKDFSPPSIPSVRRPTSLMVVIPSDIDGRRSSSRPARFERRNLAVRKTQWAQQTSIALGPLGTLTSNRESLDSIHEQGENSERLVDRRRSTSNTLPGVSIPIGGGNEMDRDVSKRMEDLSEPLLPRKQG